MIIQFLVLNGACSVGTFVVLRKDGFWSYYGMTFYVVIVFNYQHSSNFCKWNLIIPAASHSAWTTDLFCTVPVLHPTQSPDNCFAFADDVDFGLCYQVCFHVGLSDWTIRHFIPHVFRRDHPGSPIYEIIVFILKYILNRSVLLLQTGRTLSWSAANLEPIWPRSIIIKYVGARRQWRFCMLISVKIAKKTIRKTRSSVDWVYQMALWTDCFLERHWAEKVEATDGSMEHLGIIKISHPVRTRVLPTWLYIAKKYATNNIIQCLKLIRE